MRYTGGDSEGWEGCMQVVFKVAPKTGIGGNHKGYRATKGIQMEREVGKVPQYTQIMSSSPYFHHDTALSLMEHSPTYLPQPEDNAIKMAADRHDINNSKSF